MTVEEHGIRFPIANDQWLESAVAYGPTSTYLIDLDGTIAARWLDRIHERAGPETILEALDRLADPAVEGR